MPHPHVSIAGAGIIGLSLALELHRRGFAVVVLDRATPLAEASTAAAGMLAVDDPDNPPQLHQLSQLSRFLYPAFLDRLHALSGHRVHRQTATTLQSITAHRGSLPPLSPADLHRHLPSLRPGPHTFTLLDEISIDPREFASALLLAVQATTIDLRPHTPVLNIRTHPLSIEVETPTGSLHAEHFVDCTGAWSLSTPLLSQLPITPRKGQMLAIELPPSLPLTTVVRTPDIYIVPRSAGPNSGRAIIGATIEDVGFNKTVLPRAIADLHAKATDLLPPLAEATILDAWAGLRPSTPDHLPILGYLTSKSESEAEAGTHPSRRLIAGGHFRNGILLAPATAHVIADLLTGRSPSADLSPFSPQRSPFRHIPVTDIRPPV